MKELHTDEDLFSAALALPTPERHRYLERACGESSAAFKRLKALIDAFEDATNFAADRSAFGQPPPEQIGSYSLLKELGEGGCGVAYLAEQSLPVKRHVALKIIKPGMDTKAVVARFKAEQQVLALMDHPHVAKVFDAGSTSAGRPYFVMELVRGLKITEYCDHSRLNVAERLSLFTQVCQAIQHAHQKGIIHRDIKPSNVLVTMHDGLAVAKVIDFGIAKAVQGALNQTLHTAFDQFIGTPEYVSPEQTEPSQSGVDIRSDVYSLGVLLYELLTRCTPFDTSELLRAGIEQMRQRIRSEEPIKPSQRLSTSANETIQSVSGCSNTPAAKLISQIQGDLDWIVMRCLEKEPARRYQTVNDLVADLQRYLHHEPVLARPPSITYIVRKFARRNRVAFASSLVALAFLVFVTGFGIVTSIQAQRIATERDRAEREADQARRVSNVVLNALATTDPFQKLKHETTERDFLDNLAGSVTVELSGQAEARAHLLEAVGIAYRRRGQVNEAITYLRDALQTRTQMRNGDDLATAKVMIELSMAIRLSGDLNGAEEMLSVADRLAKRRGLERTPLYAKLLLFRGQNELIAGKLSEARTDLQQSLKLRRESPEVPRTDVATVLMTLSNLSQWEDNLDEAESTAREAVTILEPLVPAMHPDRVIAQTRVAEVLYLQNRIEDAEALFLDSLRKQTDLFGRTSSQVASLLDSLAGIRRLQGRLAEAEVFARQAISASEGAHGREHATTAVYAATLARILLGRAKYAEAELQLRRILGIYAIKLPPDHQYIASAEYFLGEVYLATNRLTEAERNLTASMNRWKRSDGPAWQAARSASALGEALHRLGRVAEAERYLTDSFRELSVDSKAEREAKDKARERVARLLKNPPSAQNQDDPARLASRRHT